MTTWLRTPHRGIQVRHRAACPAPDKRCRCTPSYRVRYRNASGKPSYSPVMYDLSEARNWQTDTRKAKGTERTNTADTFDGLFQRWLEGAQAGRIPQRNREPYRPRTLDIYERSYARHVKPSYGDRPAASLTALDWQLLIDALGREHHLSHNSLQTIFNSVRAVYRWACAPSRRYLTSNETRGVEMPAKDEVKRERVATPEEAAHLLSALTEPCDVVTFALALYAGLRNMERAPLDWSWLDLDRNVIHVRVSKSKAGLRKVPIIGRLRTILLREWMRQGQPTTGLVVKGPNGSAPDYDKQRRRVAKEWEAAGLQRITPHESRHTFATLLITAMAREGKANPKVAQAVMGHASIQETWDRYGHLWPGHEDEAGALLDAYLGVEDVAACTEMTEVGA